MALLGNALPTSGDKGDAGVSDVTGFRGTYFFAVNLLERRSSAIAIGEIRRVQYVVPARSPPAR